MIFDTHAHYMSHRFDDHRGALLAGLLYLLLRKNPYEDKTGSSLKASRMAAAAK